MAIPSWYRSVVADWEVCMYCKLLVQRRVVKSLHPELLGLARKRVEKAKEIGRHDGWRLEICERKWAVHVAWLLVASCLAA